jgi:hypothetical protein
MSAHGNESMGKPEDNIHGDKIFDPAGTGDSNPLTICTPPINAPKTASSSYLTKALFTIRWWYSCIKTLFILAVLVHTLMNYLFLLAWLVHGVGKLIYEVLQELRGRGNIARRNIRWRRV